MPGMRRTQRGEKRAQTRVITHFVRFFSPNGGVGGRESRSGFPGMEITKFHRAAKIRAQRGPPYSQKQVCRGNKTGINLHGRVAARWYNNGRETGVHRRERKLHELQPNTLSLQHRGGNGVPSVFASSLRFVPSTPPHGGMRMDIVRLSHPLVFRSIPTPSRSVPHDPMQSCRAVLSSSSNHPVSLHFFLPHVPFLSWRTYRKGGLSHLFCPLFSPPPSAESNTFPPSNAETNSKRGFRTTTKGIFTFRTFVYLS